MSIIESLAAQLLEEGPAPRVRYVFGRGNGDLCEVRESPGSAALWCNGFRVRRCDTLGELLRTFGIDESALRDSA